MLVVSDQYYVFLRGNFNVLSASVNLYNSTSVWPLPVLLQLDEHAPFVGGRRHRDHVAVSRNLCTYSIYVFVSEIRLYVHLHSVQNTYLLSLLVDDELCLLVDWYDVFELLADRGHRVVRAAADENKLLAIHRQIQIPAGAVFEIAATILIMVTLPAPRRRVRRLLQPL